MQWTDFLPSFDVLWGLIFGFVAGVFSDRIARSTHKLRVTRSEESRRIALESEWSKLRFDYRNIGEEGSRRQWIGLIFKNPTGFKVHIRGVLLLGERFSPSMDSQPRLAFEYKLNAKSAAERFEIEHEATIAPKRDDQFGLAYVEKHDLRSSVSFANADTVERVVAVKALYEIETLSGEIKLYECIIQGRHTWVSLDSFNQLLGYEDSRSFSELPMKI